MACREVLRCVPALAVIILLAGSRAHARDPFRGPPGGPRTVPLEMLAGKSDLIVIGTVIDRTPSVKIGNVHAGLARVFIRKVIKGRTSVPEIFVQTLFTNPNKTRLPEPTFLYRWATYLLFLKPVSTQNFVLTVPYAGTLEVRGNRVEGMPAGLDEIVRRIRTGKPKGFSQAPPFHPKSKNYEEYSSGFIKAYIRWSLQKFKADPARPEFELWARLGAKEAVPILNKLAENPSPAMSRQAVETLVRIGDASSVEVLCRIAKKTESRKALEALARIGDPASGPALVEILLKCKDDFVARLAAVALGEARYDKAVPELVERLKKAGEPLYGRILTALGEIGGDEAVKTLLPSLRAQRDPHARVEIAITLGKMGCDNALKDIFEMLADPDGEEARLIGRRFFGRSEPLQDGLDRKPEEKSPSGFSLESLREGLGHERPEVRVFVVRALASRGPESGEALTAALKDPDGRVVREAVNALERAGYEPARSVLAGMLDLPAVNVVPPAPFPPQPSWPGHEFPLHGRSFEIAYRILHVLGEIGGEEEVPVVIRKLDHRFPHMRVAALRALGAMRARQASGKILAMYKEAENVPLRNYIIEALGDMGDPACVPVLAASLEDEATYAASLLALDKIVPGDFLFYLQAYGILGSALEARKSWWDGERWKWKKALPTDAELLERVDAWIEELGSEDFATRERATKELLAVGKPAASRLEKAKKSPDPEVRMRARFISDAIRWECVLPVGLREKIADIKETLESRDPARWARLASELGAFKSPLCVPVLEELYRRGDDDVCSAVVDALSEIRHEAVRLPLSKIALEDPETASRLTAVSALGRLRDRADIPLLRKAMKDEDETVRSIAVAALGEYRDKSLVPVLIEALSDSVPVRGGAAYYLGEMKSAEALDALIEVVSNEATCVYQAVYALGQIGDRKALDAIRKAARYADSNVREAALIVLKEFR